MVGVNNVFFGDCSVGVARKVSFTLTNHHEHDAVRFCWSPPDGLVFTPCAGHLLSSCAKDIIVSFTSDKPVTLDNIRVNCKVTKIKLAEDGKKVCWWCPSNWTHLLLLIAALLMNANVRQSLYQTKPSYGNYDDDIINLYWGNFFITNKDF